MSRSIEGAVGKPPGVEVGVAVDEIVGSSCGIIELVSTTELVETEFDGGPVVVELDSGLE